MIRSLLVFDFTSERMYKEAGYALSEYASVLLDKTYDMTIEAFGIDYPTCGTSCLEAVSPSLKAAGMDNLIAVLSEYNEDAEGSELLMWCERLNHALHFDYPVRLFSRWSMTSPTSGTAVHYNPFVALNADDDTASLLVRYRSTFALAQLMEGDEPGAFGLRDRGGWATARNDEWKPYPMLDKAISIAEGHVDGRRIKNALSNARRQGL